MRGQCARRQSVCMRLVPETGRGQVISVVVAVAAVLLVGAIKVDGHRPADESNAQLQHQLLSDNFFLKSVTCTTDRPSTAHTDIRSCFGHWSGGFCADASGDYYDQLRIAVSGDAYKTLRDQITSQGTCDASVA